MDSLLQHGANINAKNAGGEAMLLWLASSGHFDAVYYLLQHGADYNTIESLIGYKVKKEMKLSDIMESMFGHGNLRGDISARNKVIKFLTDKGVDFPVADHLTFKYDIVKTIKRIAITPDDQVANVISETEGLRKGKLYEPDVSYVKLKGDYSLIDRRASVIALSQLSNVDQNIREQAIQKVTTKPGDYDPPVLCAVSSLLLTQQHADEARFWFYACFLRAVSDANKTKDESSKEAMALLKYRYGDIERGKDYPDAETIKKLISQIVVWDKNTPRNYDPRWLMLAGLGIFTETTFDFAPQTEWEQIDATARQYFMNVAEQYKEPQGLGHPYRFLEKVKV